MMNIQSFFCGMIVVVIVETIVLAILAALDKKYDK